jgi:hypothetical protein
MAAVSGAAHVGAMRQTPEGYPCSFKEMPRDQRGVTWTDQVLAGHDQGGPQTPRRAIAVCAPAKQNKRRPDGSSLTPSRLNARCSLRGLRVRLVWCDCRAGAR